jgi:hypothetical protein
MTVEQSSHSSPLNLIAETFSSQRQEAEKQNLLRRFRDKVSDLIWSYSPAIKVKEYSMSYSYPYLEPGTAYTPSVPFQTSEGEIFLHVEGKFEKDTTPHIRPNSTRAIKLEVCFEKDGEISSLAVEYDKDENPVEETLPSLEELRKGIEVLDYMTQQYKNSNVKRAPQGFFDPRPCH